MKIVKINNNEKDISFLIDIENPEWSKMQEKSFKNLAKKIKIPGGFRPGTPAHNEKAKSLISKGEIIEKAVNMQVQNINKFLIEDKQFLELEDSLLNEQPTLNVENVDDKKLSLSFVFKKIPTVKIGDYKKISFKIDKKVTDKEINEEKQKYLNRYSELVPKENKKIENGDFVIFDFEGFIENKKMENGSSKNFELEIGSNQFIPGFEEKMIGINIGEEKKLDLKFPKDYHDKNVAGKDVSFNVKINDIKHKKSPKYNDDFVKNLKIKDVTTTKEFDIFLKNNLEKTKQENQEKEARAKLFKELANISELSHEDTYSVEQEVKTIESEYKRMFSSSKIDIDTFLMFTKQDKNSFYNDIKKQAIDNVKIKYAIIEISEKENITISDDEFNKHLEDISKSEGMKLEDLKNLPEQTIEILKEKLIFNKTIDFLINNSTK
ncbi:MAG: trigger factor [Mycoplasmoidaceae bacterium]